MQFWQALTRLKICLKWTPPLTFHDIIKPAAFLGKNSTTDVYILKHNFNYFSIKGLHHRYLYSSRGLDSQWNNQDTFSRYHKENFFFYYAPHHNLFYKRLSEQCMHCSDNLAWLKEVVAVAAATIERKGMQYQILPLKSNDLGWKN